MIPKHSEDTGLGRIFLCHSSADKETVRHLYERLRTDGFNPWFDEEDLLPGQDWQLEIPKVVRSSAIVLVCLSRSSITKTGYVQKEIKYALDVADQQPEGAIFIIPVRIEECTVPDRLSQWQWADLFKEQGYSRILKALINKGLAAQPFRMHQADTLKTAGQASWGQQEHERTKLLEPIMHELRAPAAAIRSTVDFLRRRHLELSSDMIARKFDDLTLDAELVLLQVSQVERLFGGSPRFITLQRTNVFRDIIIKTVNQIRPRLIESGFDPDNIHYTIDDIRKVILYADRTALSQAVFTLLLNAIEYAEDDPTLFDVRIDLDETREAFAIKFKDWGIGIGQQYLGRIFEKGFRAPEAALKCVTGSGMGLAMAREAMWSLGGDLKLASSYKPTEFQLILPKILQEPPR